MDFALFHLFSNLRRIPRKPSEKGHIPPLGIMDNTLAPTPPGETPPMIDIDWRGGYIYPETIDGGPRRLKPAVKSLRLE
jgi:hypothetical protein